MPNTIPFRYLWIGLSIAGLIFILTQSYFAQPRSLIAVIHDALIPTGVVITCLSLLIITSPRHRLIQGLIYSLLVPASLLGGSLKPYGTFLFLFAIFLLVDWYNHYRFNTSLTQELQRDRSTIAIGIVTSTFIFGLITEIINLPFMIWSYHIPLPSLNIFGIPALIAAFGWTPWTLSILAIFYHFMLASHPLLDGPSSKINS